MPSKQSVTKLIDGLKAGDPAAAQPLWERYFDRMVGLARKHLRGASKRTGDEEDAALSAFDSFWRRARERRFPQLLDRNNLWRLLVVITVRKAWKLRRKDLGIPEVPEGGASDLSLEQFIDREPTPQFAALVSDEYRRLLRLLDDAAPDKAATLRQIALLKMEGYRASEIAQKLGCSKRKVERKVELIRTIWSQGTDS
jgi:DNA-directed RNA polymerase specialized sigma24 family protein